MKHKKFLRCTFFCLLLLVSSCFSLGHYFPSKLSWIKKSQTTKNDVKLVLGEPHAVGSSGGTVTWTYSFYEYNVLNQTYHKELRFYWNEDTTVKHYSFNSSFPQDRRSLEFHSQSLQRTQGHPL